MALIELGGDLFAADAPAIGHGVNMHGIMGSGIAVSFKEYCRPMFDGYRRFCLEGKAELGGVFPWYDPGHDKWVMNIFSQDRPGPNATYEALGAGVGNAIIKLKELGVDSLALPRIGCGIGGLDWAVAKHVIGSVATVLDFDVEVYTPA